MAEPYHKADNFTSSLIHGSSTEKLDLINALEHIAAIDIITRPQNSAHVWNCEYFRQICAHGSHCLHKQSQLVYIVCDYGAHVAYYKIKFDTKKKVFFFCRRLKNTNSLASRSLFFSVSDEINRNNKYSRRV